MPEATILLVEDDPDDVFFLQEAFKKADRAGALQVVRDGEEGLAFLLGHPATAFALLDLKLPRKSGLEVLELRQRDAALNRIPVIVLTSSQSPADITRAYELGANSYLVKPLDAGAQLEMVKTLCAYWLGLNRVPESTAGSRPSARTQG